MMNLPLAKWRPAVYAAPLDAGQPPWRLVAILHGNFDRPEWECEWWLATARRHGWLLCPRGVPRPDAPRSLDRWTYNGSSPAVRELHAGLDRLHQAYPKLIREERAILIGFSLGAILGPRVMLQSRVKWSHAIFVEGGAGVDHSLIRQLAKRGLRRVAYLCGQHSGCGGRAKQALRLWKRRGIPARLWIMPGVGHGYSDDFDPLARKVFDWLLEEGRSAPAALQMRPGFGG